MDIPARQLVVVLRRRSRCRGVGSSLDSRVGKLLPSEQLGERHGGRIYGDRFGKTIEEVRKVSVI